MMEFMRNISFDLVNEFITLFFVFQRSDIIQR